MMSSIAVGWEQAEKAQGYPRSLTGHELVGNRLVRLVYIDEAGISKPKEEPYVVVAGVIVHADGILTDLEQHLNALVKRHIPSEHHGHFIFHAAHLFNGGGKIFKRPHKDDPKPEWPLERRLKIADDLSETFGKFDLPIALGAVERAKFPSTFPLPKKMTEGEKTIAAHVAAFMKASTRVEAWMRVMAPDEVCVLVVEDNDRARSAIRIIHNIYQTDFDRLEDATAAEEAFFPLVRIKEDPLFAPKRRSSPLQFADYAAYVYKRVLMGDRRYARFFDPLRPCLALPELDDVLGAKSS